MEVFKRAEKEMDQFLASLQKKGKVSSLFGVAVSKDEAFCFIYEANMQLLREMGVELIPFSPIHDTEIPAADGVLFYGGYPELFAKELSENEKMRQDVKEKLAGGCHAWQNAAVSCICIRRWRIWRATAGRWQVSLTEQLIVRKSWDVSGISNWERAEDAKEAMQAEGT